MKSKLKSVLTKEKAIQLAATIALGAIMVVTVKGLTLGVEALIEEFKSN